MLSRSPAFHFIPCSTASSKCAGMSKRLLHREANIHSRGITQLLGNHFDTLNSHSSLLMLFSLFRSVMIPGYYLELLTVFHPGPGNGSDRKKTRQDGNIVQDNCFGRLRSSLFAFVIIYIENPSSGKCYFLSRLVCFRVFSTCRGLRL